MFSSHIRLGTTLHQHAHSHGGGHGHSHNKGKGNSQSAGGQGHSQAGPIHRSHSQSLVASSSLPNCESGRVYVTNSAVSATSRQNYGTIGTDVEQGRTGRDTTEGNTDENSDLLARSMSSSESDALSLNDGHHQHKDDNINVKAAFIHVVGDLLQSIGVLVAAFIIYFKVIVTLFWTG